MSSTDPASTAKEILSRCDELARCSEEAGRITRPFLCESMRPLHETLGGWMRAAGMEVRTDAIGNLIGRYPDEAVHADDVALALRVMIDFLHRLAAEVS